MTGNRHMSHTHVEENGTRAAFKPAKHNVTTILRNGRPDAGLEKLLDLDDNLFVLRIIFFRKGCPASPSMTGRLRVKCSMMAPKTIGLSACQSPWLLVTVTKSEPSMTPDTPSMSRAALREATSGLGKQLSENPPLRLSSTSRRQELHGGGIGR